MISPNQLNEGLRPSEPPQIARAFEQLEYATERLFHAVEKLSPLIDQNKENAVDPVGARVPVCALASRLQIVSDRVNSVASILESVEL